MEIESHLQQLKQEFECYFSDLNDTKLPIWKMTRNPFRTSEDILPDNLQEEFIEMKCNSTAKDDFEVIRMLVVQLYGPYFRFRPLTCVKEDFLLWLI